MGVGGRLGGVGAYCCFSHDVTKNQTKKLSNLPRFYFHDALEQLKSSFHTYFRFKRVLGFVIEYAVVCLCCNKTIDGLVTKRGDVNKARSACKTPS